MEREQKKTLVLFSGGLDSYLSLELAIRDGGLVTPIFFDYGQNNMEIERANVERICRLKGLTPKFLDLTGIKSLLECDYTSGAGEKEDGSFNHIVPNRNLLFLTFAYNYALINDYTDIYTGFYFKNFRDRSKIFNRIDYLIEEERQEPMPDQTEEFLSMSSEILNYCNDGVVKIIHPLYDLDKTGVFEKLKELGELANAIKETISCYYPQEEQEEFEWGRGCGKCVNCVDRANSFAILK